MFREMRRKMQQMEREETLALLKRNTSGVLSLIGDEGYPYGVPLSYVLLDDKIYFHSAASGHKIDAMQNTDKACFTVIDADVILAQKLTTAFRSAIVFGRLRLLDGEEKMAALRAIAQRYSADFPEQIEKEIASSGSRTAVMQLTIEHVSGKRAKELSST